ncbi:MAG: VOC family protein [Actinobacteria bacterium]|nr:VOC family protein [Actinomycetota bacterium]
MSDPFDELREPVTPAAPDPAFAADLRARLIREVFAYSGGTMSQTTVHQPAGGAGARRQPAWPPTLTPYIVVSDARRALDWYADVLGAERRGEPIVNADGTIGHAELGLGDGVLMFSEPSDLWPDVPVRAPAAPTPEAPATFSSSLHLEVDDVDATTARARGNGATVEREPADQPYGRRAVIVDPFGHRWILLGRAPSRTRARQGDVGNVTITAREPRRTMEFYAAVLQVPFTEGHPNAWRTGETTPGLGILSSRGAAPEVQLSFRVDDLVAAIERVRTAGGQAGTPLRQPYGLLADCVDDQGVTFRLWQPAS